MTGPVLRDGEGMEEAVTLIEQLVAAIELREASDPDSPAWGAEYEIRHLEHEIMVSARDSAWAGIFRSERQSPID